MKHPARRTTVLAVSPGEPPDQAVNIQTVGRRAPVWRNFPHRQEHKGARLGSRMWQCEIIDRFWRPHPCPKVNQVQIQRARRIANGTLSPASRFDRVQHAHENLRVLPCPTDAGDRIQKGGQGRIRPGRRPPGARASLGYNAMTGEQLQCMTQVFKGRGTAVVLIGSQGDEYARSGPILT